MPRKALLKLPRTEYFNAHSSTLRLNDAYLGERQWKLRVAGNTMTIERTK